MTDLMLYTVAVLSIAGLTVLSLHREQASRPAAERPAASTHAWLPPESHHLAASVIVPAELWELVMARGGGYRPTFVATDELVDLAPYIEAHREAVAALAAEAEVPTVFMAAPSVAQLADVLTATSRWVPPRASVFETHPTSPQVGDVSHGRVPEGCWRTRDDDGYRPCNAPVDDDDLGLCRVHRAELRSAS